MSERAMGIRSIHFGRFLFLFSMECKFFRRNAVSLYPIGKKAGVNSCVLRYFERISAEFGVCILLGPMIKKVISYMLSAEGKSTRAAFTSPLLRNMMYTTHRFPIYVGRFAH